MDLRYDLVQSIDFLSRAFLPGSPNLSHVRDDDWAYRQCTFTGFAYVPCLREHHMYSLGRLVKAEVTQQVQWWNMRF